MDLHNLRWGPDDNRVEYRGPAVMLDAQTAVHLALVLHELATNARKYGRTTWRAGCPRNRGNFRRQSSTTNPNGS
jgi:hypothetical protein